MCGANRLGCPPMMASISGRPYRAARITDCGLPPTPTHVGRCPSGSGGLTYWSLRGDRKLPDQVTGWFRSRRVSKSSFSSEERLVVGEVVSEQWEAGLGRDTAINNMDLLGIKPSD